MLRKILYTFVSILLFYTIVGFVILPLVLKSQASKYIEENLNKTLYIDSIKFNPFLFKLDIDKLSLNDQDKAMISFDRLFVDIDLSRTISNKYLRVSQVLVDGLFVDISIDENKNLNLLSLIPPKNENIDEKKSDNDEIFKLLVDKIELLNSKITFNDHSYKEALSLDINNLNYRLRDLSTLENKIASQYLDFDLDNSSFSLVGGLSLNPLKTYGNLELRDLFIYKFWEILKDDYPIELDKELNLSLKSGFTLNLEDELSASIDSAFLDLQNFSIKQDKEEILKLGKFTFEKINLLYPQKSQSKLLKSDLSLDIDNAKLDMDMLFDIDTNSLNLKYDIDNLSLSLFATLAKNYANIDLKSAILASKGELDIIDEIVDLDASLDIHKLDMVENSSKLDLKINSLLSQNKIHFQDKKADIISSLDIKDLKVVENNLKLNASSKKITSQNSITLDNNDLTLQTDTLIDSINLVEKNKDLDIAIKALHTKGGIDLIKEQLNTKIDLNISSLKLDNKNISLIKAGDFYAKDIVYNQSKNILDIAKIDIKEPYAYIKIEKDGSLNLASLALDDSSPTIKEPKTQDKPMEINIGPIDIQKGAMRFEDLTLPIYFRLENKNIKGSFSEFSTKSTKPSILSLDGNIGEYGHMKISGDLLQNDIKNYTNLKLDFNNIALSDLSGYSGKFVGRKIEDGKLSLDLKYYIDKYKLDAKNNLIIDKIQLGQKIESEEALNLPLDLAIAILEDKNGIIDIKLPIKGDLDNPEFSIAPIVWQAFTNIISKVLTAPFSLLGSLFGFEEDEISSVPFYFGSSQISPISQEPLDKIVEILSQRDKLIIKLAPSYDEKKDLFALQELSFKDSVEKLFKEISKEEYEAKYLSYLEDGYQNSNKKLSELQKQYTKDGVLEEHLYIEGLESFLIKQENIEPQALEELAYLRTQAIKEYLVLKGINTNQIELIKTIQKHKSKDDKFCSIELKVDVLQEGD
ncbi:MAG: DUF748 domain-containing protein [Arcobacteraceae bacterium]